MGHYEQIGEKQLHLYWQSAPKNFIIQVSNKIIFPSNFAL
jgi:hypothetical protein